MSYKFNPPAGDTALWPEYYQLLAEFLINRYESSVALGRNPNWHRNEYRAAKAFLLSEALLGRYQPKDK